MFQVIYSAYETTGPKNRAALNKIMGDIQREWLNRIFFGSSWPVREGASIRVETFLTCFHGTANVTNNRNDCEACFIQKRHLQRRLS